MEDGGWMSERKQILHPLTLSPSNLLPPLYSYLEPSIKLSPTKSARLKAGSQKAHQ